MTSVGALFAVYTDIIEDMDTSLLLVFFTTYTAAVIMFCFAVSVFFSKGKSTVSVKSLA